MTTTPDQQGDSTMTTTDPLLRAINACREAADALEQSPIRRSSLLIHTVSVAELRNEAHHIEHVRDTVLNSIHTPADVGAVADVIGSEMDKIDTIDVVFDGPPGPVSGRFVEVEDYRTRASIRVGEWIERDDGMWALRITR